MIDLIDTQAMILETAMLHGFAAEEISSDVQIKILHMLQITYESMMDVGLFGAEVCDAPTVEEATKILNLHTWQFVNSIFSCARVLREGTGALDPTEDD